MYFINMPKMESLEDIHTVPNEFSQEDERKRGACHLGQACPGRQNGRWRWREVRIWPRAAGASFVDRHLRASHSRQSAAANRQLIPPQLPLKAADAWHHNLTVPRWGEINKTDKRLQSLASLFLHLSAMICFGDVTATNWEKAQGERDDSKFRTWLPPTLVTYKSVLIEEHPLWCSYYVNMRFLFTW